MTKVETTIWKTFAKAIGADLREDTIVRGASGLEHEVQAIAVDEKTKRLIIVSAESDPRMAALVQVDVQATIPDARVLVARPIAIDVGMMARTFLEPLGIMEIDFDKAREFVDSNGKIESEEAKKFLSPYLDNESLDIQKIFDNVELPIVNQIFSVISQISLLQWREIWRMINEKSSKGILDFRPLINSDTISSDLKAGVCPVPLYNFSENDFENFKSGRDVDYCIERMKEIGIYQYFFPAPDQLALALVENGIRDQKSILGDTALAPQLGHPFGEFEILDNRINFKDIVDNLNDRKLIVEGEYGFEISPEGTAIRGQVKFSPRESLISKILNRISVNLSPADFIK